jgi:GT2 family glycosyltransferase
VAVSVVICAYTGERWALLRAAVASVRSQTSPPGEIFVVVDHDDALLARVRAEIDGVAAIPSREARGLSGARNSGVAATRGDVVAFLDDDAVAAPDWLEHLTAPYADARVLGVGGAIEPRWLGGRPPGFPAEFDWVVGCTYAGMPTRRGLVRNLIGANMSMRRDVLDAAGGFRAGIGRVGLRPTGCEETELCIRAARRLPGGTFVHEPRARVAHAVPADRATWRYFRARCFAEGQSKARVAAVAGRHDGLASERAFALRTLPAAVGRGLADAAHGDRAGLTRAGAVVAGLALTTAGYVAGSVRLVGA